MKGVVSSGSTEATKAGLFALEKGGNAIDAAICAQLAAFVAEPLLTGFAGAGIASLRVDGELQLVDMFTTMPGMGREINSCEFEAIDIDFGPATQRFFVGLGSIATPTMPQGLIYLHKNFARLPLKTLVQPAIHLARNGFQASRGLETVVKLLFPIVMRSPVMERWFGRQGRAIREGELCVLSEMEKDLYNFAHYGEELFQANDYRKALDAISNQTLLSREDIGEYSPKRRFHRTKDFCDHQIQLCSEPSIGGLILDDLLEPMHDIPSDPLGFEAVQLLGARLRAVFGEQQSYSKTVLQRLTEQFIPNSSGFTTHLSVVDAEGNAIGITSSLGESAGVVLNNSGIILNNFLGEADVAPPMARTKAGRRLLTMCSPTLVTSASSNDIMVYGSGGSNRIASAIFQGIVYSLAYDYPIEKVVSAPRMHVTGDVLQLETFARSPKTILQLQENYGERLREFSTPNMFFGGLHVAGINNGILSGMGDQRRAGVSGLSK